MTKIVTKSCPRRIISILNESLYLLKGNEVGLFTYPKNVSDEVCIITLYSM